MHKEAKEEAIRFSELYLKDAENLQILDVGSYSVNGSLREVFEKHGNYTGLDIQEGKNVDIVSPVDNFIFTDNMFDVIVSSSCFEHNIVFWKTFEEMIRVAKSEALIFINTPSRGGYHGYPLDCWRFYKDAYKALEMSNSGKVELLEQRFNDKGHWGDNIGIFKVK